MVYLLKKKGLREEIMRAKAEKSSFETENFTLRQEIEAKNREIKNNYELYRSQKLEYENFLKQVFNFFSKILNIMLLFETF